MHRIHEKHGSEIDRGLCRNWEEKTELPLLDISEDNNHTFLNLKASWICAPSCFFFRPSPINPSEIPRGITSIVNQLFGFGSLMSSWTRIRPWSAENSISPEFQICVLRWRRKMVSDRSCRPNPKSWLTMSTIYPQICHGFFLTRLKKKQEAPQIHLKRFKKWIKIRSKETIRLWRAFNHRGYKL